MNTEHHYNDHVNGQTFVSEIQDQDEDFFSAVRNSLDEGCESLDGYTRSRLTAIRHEALARQGGMHRWMRWIPAGGIATACSVIVAFTLISPSGGAGDVEAVSNDALQDLDLLTAEEGLEFFEDYEFYQWLAGTASSA